MAALASKGAEALLAMADSSCEAEPECVDSAASFSSAAEACVGAVPIAVAILL